ncbi:hypothetical protein ACIPPM_02840 [Streptomyces sp. NPDC090119]|uniref:hypothetical protein n=1 Tax=Streptomyces sp. NPDC090119 TaxID=3365951 RepID=UPI00382D8B78
MLVSLSSPALLRSCPALLRLRPACDGAVSGGKLCCRYGKRVAWRGLLAGAGLVVVADHGPALRALRALGVSRSRYLADVLVSSRPIVAAALNRRPEVWPPHMWPDNTPTRSACRREG